VQYELLEDQRHQCTTAYSAILKTFRTKFVTKEQISNVWLKACCKVFRLQIRNQSKSELVVIIASILFAQNNVSLPPDWHEEPKAIDVERVITNATQEKEIARIIKEV
ncbi:hypothetical protein M427DRAFT_59628, partial [Gonapodya prolifera JEL478]